MTATYDRCGVRFMYPESWKICEDQSDGWPKSILIQAPTGAFWSIELYPATPDVNSLMSEAVQAMREEYGDLETESVTESIAGISAAGYNIQFYCLDLIISARFRAFRADERTFLLHCQAEDREFDRLEPVFRAITESLVRHDLAT